MIGLYLLKTNRLVEDETVKFGMSMRIECRWIDYLDIFSDAEYIYYYELLDNLTRKQILAIEYEILKIHKNERSPGYQTEYFKCTNYKKFNQSIINTLSKLKINYRLHDIHDFNKVNYDNKPESFKLDKDPGIEIISFLESDEELSIGSLILESDEELSVGSLILESDQEVSVCSLTPRPDQEIIINKILTHFQTNERGILSLPCGVGKTLIALWGSQRLKSSKIVIGAPNKLLVDQWSIEIEKIFPTVKSLIVKDCLKSKDIEKFLKTNKESFIITTYSSCHKVASASKKLNMTFDMKINDECHHLTSTNMKLENTTKTYIEMLKIPSVKQLSLTATLKTIEKSNNDTALSIVSNDNIDYFGEVVYEKCLLWAIDEKIICDYKIQTISIDEEKLEDIFQKFDIKDKNKRLFLSAYASLKSISCGNSHHLLVYSNNTENSNKIINYIRILLDEKYFDLPDLFFSIYIGVMRTKEQANTINDFEKAQYGIIACVYCLGEGWDLPKLDGVVFSENMTSNIRIVQSALRPSRKNKKEPNKISKIILPILHRDDWLENCESTDLKNVIEVIHQMALEDKTVMSKVKAYKISINTPGENKNDTVDNIDNLGYHDEELTKKLILKTRPRPRCDTQEKVMRIIREQPIKINSKKLYYELCSKDVRLPLNPDEIFKGNFDWIYFLSIERTLYYTLDKCKEMCGIYLKKNPEIKKHLDLSSTCKELCELDDKFPPNDLWVEFYKVKQLSEIIKISSSPKKRCVNL